MSQSSRSADVLQQLLNSASTLGGGGEIQRLNLFFFLITFLLPSLPLPSRRRGPPPYQSVPSGLLEERGPQTRVRLGVSRRRGPPNQRVPRAPKGVNPPLMPLYISAPSNHSKHPPFWSPETLVFIFIFECCVMVH